MSHHQHGPPGDPPFPRQIFQGIDISRVPPLIRNLTIVKIDQASNSRSYPSEELGRSYEGEEPELVEDENEIQKVHELAMTRMEELIFQAMWPENLKNSWGPLQSIVVRLIRQSLVQDSRVDVSHREQYAEEVERFRKVLPVENRIIQRLVASYFEDTLDLALDYTVDTKVEERREEKYIRRTFRMVLVYFECAYGLHLRGMDYLNGHYRRYQTFDAIGRGWEKKLLKLAGVEEKMIDEVVRKKELGRKGTPMRHKGEPSHNLEHPPQVNTQNDGPSHPSSSSTAKKSNKSLSEARSLLGNSQTVLQPSQSRASQSSREVKRLVRELRSDIEEDRPKPVEKHDILDDDEDWIDDKDWIEVAQRMSQFNLDRTRKEKERLKSGRLESEARPSRRGNTSQQDPLGRPFRSNAMTKEVDYSSGDINNRKRMGNHDQLSASAHIRHGKRPRVIDDRQGEGSVSTEPEVAEESKELKQDELEDQAIIGDQEENEDGFDRALQDDASVASAEDEEVRDVAPARQQTRSQVLPPQFRAPAPAQPPRRQPQPRPQRLQVRPPRPQPRSQSQGQPQPRAQAHQPHQNHSVFNNCDFHFVFGNGHHDFHHYHHDSNGGRHYYIYGGQTIAVIDLNHESV